MLRLIHLQIGLTELEAAPRSLAVFGIYAIHVVAFGLMAFRVSKLRLKWPIAYSAYLTFGYAAFGFYIWAAGYFGALVRSFFLISAICWGLIAIILLLRKPPTTAMAQTFLDKVRARPLLVGIVIVTLSIAITSGARGIAFDDDYRWQSAKAWVAAGHWIKVPYRLTNGTAMSEMLHVPGAAFGDLTAAHWASTGIWICRALNAAAIAQTMGVSALVAIISVLSIPVFTSSSSTLNSDIPAVAFSTAAFVFLLGQQKPDMSPRALILAGVLLAAVLSSKFVVLACLPGAVAICLWSTQGTSYDRAINASILLAPLLFAGMLWMAHTYHLTGRPFDPSGKYLAKTPDDPMWLDGEAAGRIPRTQDLLRLPIEPILTTIWGQEEPFGGRTGLLWLALLPATLFLAVTRQIAWKTPLAYLLLAISFYMLLAPILLKTRFLLFFFVWMALLSAAAYEHRRLLPRWAARTVTFLFIATATLGILDGNRKLLMNVLIDTPPARHPPRVI